MDLPTHGNFRVLHGWRGAYAADAGHLRVALAKGRFAERHDAVRIFPINARTVCKRRVKPKPFGHAGGNEVSLPASAEKHEG